MLRTLFATFLSTLLLCSTGLAQASLSCSQVFSTGGHHSEKVLAIPADDYVFWPVTIPNIDLPKLATGLSMTGTLPADLANRNPYDSTKAGIVLFKDSQNFFNNKQLFVGEALPIFEKDIRSALNVVFKSYLDRNIVSSNSVQEFIELENKLPVNRSVYFVARDPVLRSAKEVIRLFDASPKNKTIFRNGFARTADNSVVSRLPIEVEYPHIQLPERFKDKKDQYLIELGRLVKTADVTEQEISHIFSKVANFLYENHDLKSASNGTPVIYIEATAAGKRLYAGKYGFSIAFGPNEIGISDRYILKMDAWEFVAKFLKKDTKTKFTRDPRQSSDQFYSELSEKMQYQHVRWPSKTVSNKNIDTNGLSWLDASRNILTEENLHSAKVDFNQQFVSTNKLYTNNFWTEFRRATSQLLIHDQMSQQLTEYIHQLLPKEGSILHYGNLNFTLPIALAKRAGGRTLSLQGYSTEDVLDFSEIADGLHLNKGQLLINQPQKPGETPYDAVVISDSLFHFQTSQDVDSFLKNIFQSLKSGGIVVLKEPTPRDGPKNSFNWYTGLTTALEGKSSATYRDLFFTLEGAETIADSEASLRFLSAEKIQKITQDAGFKIVSGERVLDLSSYLLVLKKP